MRYRVSKSSIVSPQRILGYILTTILVFLQGSVLFSGSRVLLIVFLFVAFGIFIIKNIKFDKFIFIVFFFLIIVSIAQFFKFSFISYTTLIGTLTRFLLPYFFIKIINKNYLKYFVNVLFFFTIISLLLYIPSVLFPAFYNFLLSLSGSSGIRNLMEENNLIVYTVETDVRLGFLRNSGFFWEPGAFSGFLIVALLCNIVINRRLWNFKNIIFLFTIITTFSTSGYIAMFMVVLFYYMVNLNKRITYFLIPLLCLSAWYSYFQLDFLGERINTEIQMTEKGDVKYTGRLGSGEKDFQDIKKYPLIGRGRNVNTRFESYDKNDILEFHRTNGVTDFAVKYGMLFWIFYFFNIYKSFRLFCENYNFSSKFALYILLVIFTIGFSQTFFQGTFFISFLYLHVLYKRNPPITKARRKANAKDFSRYTYIQS